MPPTFRIIMSPEAAGDLEAIHKYIARDSPENAAQLIERILDAIATLDIFPHRKIVEHRTPELQHPVRSVAVRPYVIYFRVLEAQQAVRILTVRHGARRPPDRFE